MTNTALHQDLPRLNISLALSDLVDVTCGHLVAANDPAVDTPTCYMRGGKIVRVHIDEHQRPRLVEIPEAGMKVEIDRIVKFYKVVRKRGEDPVDVDVRPADDIVKGVLAARAIALPKLTGLTECPVLRSDGTVLETPGYDQATGLFYWQQPDTLAVPQIPETPTDDEVTAAFAALADILCDFPYHNVADKANALAALLTPIMRPAIRGHIPLGAFDSPKQGNGKSLLGEVITVIHTGHTDGSYTEAKDDDEWRKRVLSVALAGTSIAIIDNVRRDLDSAALASVLTKDTVTDRILGESRQVTFPISTVWFATGNNLRLGGDMVRRVYRIRLDAQQARPWTRTVYRHPDLLAYVKSKRPVLLAAALTIGRAWFARGCPQGVGVPAFASFNEWAQTLAGVLALGGVEGFLGNLTELWDVADDEADEWEPFLRAWEGIFADTPITARTIYETCAGVRDLNVSDVVMNLRASLPGNLADEYGKAGSFTRKLGWALKKHKDARYGDAGYRIEYAGEERVTHVALWRVQHDRSGGDGDGHESGGAVSRGFSRGFSLSDVAQNGHRPLDANADLAGMDPVQSKETRS